MSDFATYAKKINEALLDPSVKFICRAIAALVAADVADEFMVSLAKQMEIRPLTGKQIDAAKKALHRKYVSHLARLAVAAKAPGTAAVATPTAPVKPSALPAKGERRPKGAAKKAKKPQERDRVHEANKSFYTADHDEVPPWEADNSAYRAECEVLAMEACQS